MTTKIFITGTDTSAGKTYVSCKLLRSWANEKMQTQALKPIASGCDMIDGAWRNDDALQLQAAASIQLPYEKINPINFVPPIAPHIAAKQSNDSLSVQKLNEICHPIMNESTADMFLIEGVGGWLVPLNETETMADWVAYNNFDVILVVGMKLGCLNHALLSYQAIRQHDCNIIGWVANQIDPEMLEYEENINTLKKHLPIPCLKEIKFN